MERLGVEKVGVAVEWSTSGLGVTKQGHPSPCELCAPLKGIVLTVAEARGLIPRHEECRCSWIPANVGEDKAGQKRSKKVIEKAIDKSIMAEIPKGSKVTLAEQKERSSWVGAKRTIAKKRPKSIFD